MEVDPSWTTTLDHSFLSSALDPPEYLGDVRELPDHGLLLGGFWVETVSSGIGTTYHWHLLAAKTTPTDTLACP